MIQNLVVWQELEEERSALVERIEKEENLLAAPIGINPDPADRAQQYTFKQQRLAVLAQSRQQLEQVETALRRVEEGVYGLCVDCGEQIDPARLKALPYALLCVNCQEWREKMA